MAGAEAGGGGAERRRAPRYPIRLPVTLVASGGSLPSQWGHTVDVCLRGVRVVTDADLARDVDLTVFLDVGEGEPIVAGADPVWTERRRETWVHGMVLRGMSDEDEVRLDQVCTRA